MSLLLLIVSKHLFIIAALSLLCLRYSIAGADSSICSTSDCGNGVPIRYPFWVNNDSAQEYCGYPDFGLRCSDHDGQPILSLPRDTYYVTDINYDNHTLTLVDIDVVNQSCPRVRHNVSLGNFPLRINLKLNVNQRFYFNCSVSNVNLPPQHIGCLKNEGSKQSYVAYETTDEWNLDCEEKVVVAVKEEIRRSDNLVSGFGEAMKKGFVLDWQRAMECIECEDSGGQCGHNQTNHQMLCFCSDGSISTRSCRKEKEYWECRPSPCGKVGQIEYPFWSENSRPHYCGRPEFQLYCPLYEDDYPSIRIGSQTFNVTYINPFAHKMTLVRTDFVYDNCSSYLTKTSVSSLNLFHYVVPSVKNVTLFYGCYQQDDLTGGIKFTCLYSLNYAFFQEDVMYKRQFSVLNNICMSHIEVPVSIETDVPIQDYSQALKEALGKGLGVRYDVDESCAKCRDSDGRCGSNDTSPFVCYCRDGHHPLFCPDSSRHALKPKLIIGVSGAIGLLLLCITICSCKIKSWGQRIGLCKTSEVDQNIEAFIRNHGALALTRYKFADVKKMTNSFKDKLGQGGYGSVYKGKLLNGRPVAVKLLKASKENGEDFVNEVASISRTSHVNVVTLLGFCFEGKQEALIYEFMPNGSLDKFIRNNADENSLCLTWENLYQIAIGIARGLEYLHRGCNTRILHFDIKPHNILLDENFCPKISDFGLAKLCLKKYSIISISEARGRISCSGSLE